MNKKLKFYGGQGYEYSNEIGKLVILVVVS